MKILSFLRTTETRLPLYNGSLDMSLLTLCRLQKGVPRGQYITSGPRLIQRIVVYVS